MCAEGLPHKHTLPNTHTFIDYKESEKKKEHKGCDILCVAMLVSKCEKKKEKIKENGVLLHKNECKKRSKIKEKKK